jgi:hypothetical protein
MFKSAQREEMYYEDIKEPFGHRTNFSYFEVTVANLQPGSAIQVGFCLGNYGLTVKPRDQNSSSSSPSSTVPQAQSSAYYFSSATNKVHIVSGSTSRVPFALPNFPTSVADYEAATAPVLNTNVPVQKPVVSATPSPTTASSVVVVDEKKSTPYRIKTGDIIGVGYDSGAQAIFFTLNGLFLGQCERGRVASWHWHAMISLGSKDDKVTVNFGSKSFRFYHINHYFKPTSVSDSRYSLGDPFVIDPLTTSSSTSSASPSSSSTVSASPSTALVLSSNISSSASSSSLTSSAVPSSSTSSVTSSLSGPALSVVVDARDLVVTNTQQRSACVLSASPLLNLPDKFGEVCID